MSDTEFGRDWDIARHIEFALSPHAVHNNAWNESAEMVRAHITTQATALDRLTDHLARVGECPPDSRDYCDCGECDTDADDFMAKCARCWITVAEAGGL